MGEVRDLAKTLTVLIIVSLFTYLLFLNPFTLDDHRFSIVDYEAHLTPGGILYENYTYSINSDGALHMLYRHWSTPLYYGPLRDEGIYLLNVSYRGNLSHVIPYVKTHYSGVYILNNASYSSGDVDYIARKAWKSEAGIYVPTGIPAGKYTVSYVFLLYPVLEKHGDYYHLPLDLGIGHNTYLHSRISMPAGFNPQGPPYLSAERKGENVVYTGRIYGGFTLVFDLLFTNASGFPHYSVRNVDYDIPSYVSRAHMYESIRYYIAYTMFLVPYYIVVFMPVAYLLIYLLFGRDHARPIEEEVMTPPERRSPWVVNYIFKNQGIRVDYRETIIATLLNMHRKGIIEISKGGREVRVLNENPEGGLEDYEQQVLDFIKNNSRGGVMDLSAEKVKSKDILRIEPELENKTFDQFIYLPDKRIGYTFLFIVAYVLLVGVFIIVCIPYALYIIWGTTLLIPYLIQIFAIWKFPEVLGRWKDDYYTEKLRWDKFREFLSDEEKLRMHYREFSSYLDDWLIYGYALGVGDKVRTVLNAPGIEYHLAQVAEDMYMYVPTVFVPPPSSTSGGGGFAGGFGGGGAGAR